MAVLIQNLTRRPVTSRLLFTRIADEVLPSFEISLVFVGPTRARTLNQTLRKKDYVPNVLSYKVGVRSGEILICPSEALKQAPAYGLPPTDYILFLFIHGLLHIKGGVHGATMERSEQKLLAKFAKSSYRPLPHVTTNSNRDRHRHVPGKNGRGRGAHR